jgi:3-hydroxybutyryl-CoA dehydrogenase
MSEAEPIAVIGAGVIGRGVAQCCASHGYPVILVDLSTDVLDKAMEDIRGSGRRLGLFAKRDQTLIKQWAEILTTTAYAAIGDCTVVIENITEDPASKIESYALIERYSKPEALLVANTSVIPITQIGSWLARPDRLVGIHFMNPVPLTTTVELIRGHHSSSLALDQAKAFLDAIGKKYIIEEDSAGFVSNRVLMLAINEAVYLVQERVADPQQVDRVFVECFGHSMGMLETADLIGLDTVLHSIELLHQYYRDAKFHPCPLLKRMVDAGTIGRKSGQGFYSY